MTLVSEKTLPLKNAIKDILLKIKNNETAMATSAIGLGVAGAALSFPLFRYVGFDSLGGGTAFLVSTAISTVSAITALMGVYKLSSITINKLSQALDPIADRIDNSVKNFKERLNGFWNAHPLARDLLQATGVISSRFAPGSSDSFENEIGKTEALSGVDSLYNALHQMTPEKRELLNLMSKGFFPSIFEDSQERGFDPDGELKKLETEKNADGHYASSEKIRETREKMTAFMDGFTNKADHDAFLESKIDIKNILEAVNKSPRVDIAPKALTSLSF